MHLLIHLLLSAGWDTSVLAIQAVVGGLAAGPAIADLLLVSVAAPRFLVGNSSILLEAASTVRVLP